MRLRKRRLSMLMLFAGISIFSIGCNTTPTIGTASVTPVQFGKKHKVLQAAAVKSDVTYYILGIALKTPKTHAQLVGEIQKAYKCDVMQDVYFKTATSSAVGFASKIVTVTGKCLGPQ